MKYFYSLLELFIKLLIIFSFFYLTSFINLKFMKNEYLLLNIENLFYFTISIMILYHSLFYDYRKRLIYKIPKVFNFFNTIDKDNKKIRIYDKVIKYRNGKFIIKNKTGLIDLEEYRNNIDKLEHYLNSETIKINKYKNDSIIIDILDRFPKNLELNISHLKKGKMFLGVDENGKFLYIDLKDTSHFGMSGAAGAGKSVQQRLYLASLLFNLDEKDENGNDYIDKIYLVDYKLVSYFQWQFIHPKIKVATNNKEVFPLINECFEENKKRQQYLISTPDENGNYKEKITTNMVFIMFDEWAEFKDSCPDKNLDKNGYLEFNKCLTQIKSIIQTGRSQNLRVLIASQTLKTEVLDSRIRSNLQSRICMKSKDSESVIAVLGSSEPADELGVNPKSFNYGRHILLLDSPHGVVNHYLQGLYSPENFYKEIMTLKGWKPLNDTKPSKEEIIPPEPLKTSEIRNITHSDNVELRKELFSMTSKITDEHKQKELRTRLTKINSFIKSEDYNIDDINKQLNIIKKEII